MLYLNNLPHSPSEIEDGYWYAIPGGQSSQRIIEVVGGRVLDGRNAAAPSLDYTLVGQVPTQKEIVDTCNALSAGLEEMRI